ncbi:MAG: alpha-L-rhamnosidase C-terminal domain-containing protein [Acidimicrobiales bacterium]
MRLHHPDPFAPRWHARWIWHEPPAIVAETATRPVAADPRDAIGLFRRAFTLDAVPASVPCRAWADGRYVLRVNGVEVARGPVRSDPRRARYDVVDLAPHLVVGENVVAVVARHFGAATSWWMPVPATYTLGAGCLVLEAKVGEGWIGSDAGWRCLGGEAWTPVPVPGDVACLPLESFDAARHPHGWDRPGFDDGAWRPAHEILPVHTGSTGDARPSSEPFGVLRPPVRRSFPGGAAHRAAPLDVTVVAGAEPVADPVAQVYADQASGEAAAGDGIELHTFDLGRIAAGTVALELAGAAPGTVVDVAAAEHLDAAGDLVALGQHAGFRYVAGGPTDASGVERFETFDTIGTRYLRAAVRAPRGTAAPALALAVADRHRPRPAGASFACSDPLLERIYEVGLRTVDLCALDAYVDCPTREQRAWTGDAVVHQMVDLVANPDWSMAIWHPQLAAAPRPDGMLAMAVASDFEADDRTFIPDWSLHWVRSVHNLMRYVGDRDLVAELLPVAERALRWFEAYLGDDGLLHDVTGWSLVDWASVRTDGTSSTVNALWARGLEDVAELARWLGNEGTARWADARRADVAGAFDAFWDEGRGVYVDHILDGDPRRPAAQHPGAAALAAGLVPADRVDRVVAGITDRSRLVRHSWVMDTVTAEGGSTGFIHLVMGHPDPDWDVERQMVAAEPFFRYVVHDGLARAGRADLVADLCRDWSAFLDAGETTWPECWNGGTRCHGWSSTPTRDLIVHVLGISPAEPGYAAVRVAPSLGGLDWARATVPTPHGPITVEARADGTVEVDSPVPVVRP